MCVCVCKAVCVGGRKRRMRVAWGGGGRVREEGGHGNDCILTVEVARFTGDIIATMSSI